MAFKNIEDKKKYQKQYYKEYYLKNKDKLLKKNRVTARLSYYNNTKSVKDENGIKGIKKGGGVMTFREIYQNNKQINKEYRLRNKEIYSILDKIKYRNNLIKKIRLDDTIPVDQKQNAIKKRGGELIELSKELNRLKSIRSKRANQH